MRKLRILCSLFLVLIVASACQNHAADPEEQTTANFDFDLPNAYSISEIDGNACAVYKGTEQVGGIILTGLNNGKIADIDQTELRQYLDPFAPSPLIYEYMAMYFSDDFDYVSIKFVITDPETQASTVDHHYLFERAGGCYDLWLMDKLVDEAEQSALLASVCS